MSDDASADPLPTEEGGRPPWSQFKAALDAVGFHPSRRLGQNFLLDDNLAAAIVRDAGVAADDFVLEVGAGCGFLSVHLARSVARLVAVEIDDRLFTVVSRFLAGEPNVQLLHGDVLESKHRLSAEVTAALPDTGAWHLVGNLPYSISAPLVAVLSDLTNPPSSMTVMVQHEVGERLLATPGTADWGPLGVRLSMGYGGERVRSVPANLFWPRPKVASAVVRLVRREDGIGGDERDRIAALAAGLFQRRRQSLGRLFAERLGDRARAMEALERLRIDPARRAETLSIADLQALAALE